MARRPCSAPISPSALGVQHRAAGVRDQDLYARRREHHAARVALEHNGVPSCASSPAIWRLRAEAATCRRAEASVRRSALRHFQKVAQRGVLQQVGAHRGGFSKQAAVCADLPLWQNSLPKCWWSNRGAAYKMAHSFFVCVVQLLGWSAAAVKYRFPGDPWCLGPGGPVGGVGGGACAEANWPDRPVRVIVPFPASGATSLVARVVAQRVAADLGQQLVVDNKPGAGGLGTAEAAKAAPDGYTLLLTTSSTHAISPHLMPKLAYDPRKDFVPVAHVADAPSVLLVTNSLPAKTVGELIAYCPGPPRQAQLRHQRQRHHRAPEHRCLQRPGGRGHDAHPLQGRRWPSPT